MKHLFTLALAGVMSIAASAQAVQGQKFLDNWSVGVYGGAVAPTTHHGVFSNARGVAGVEVMKAFTPYFGLGIQASAGINTTGSHTVIDQVTPLVVGKFNLSNIFCGYPRTACGDKLTGAPRAFEVVAVAGIGFTKFLGHSDKEMTSSEYYANGIHAVSKFGLEFNYNFGKDKEWTVGLRPAIVYDLETTQEEHAYVEAGHAAYNINGSALELTAGVTYHFNNSNGHHHFTYVREYDQAEVDGLNAKINDLRGQLGTKDQQLGEKDGQIRRLQQELNDCRNQKPQTQTQTIINTNKALESYVTFAQGKSTISKDQQPNVERVATFLKNHKNSKVVIKGYASPEGSKAINEKLAKNRAEAVKTMLVNKYKISADRISAEGQGVGNLFEEPDWNRVSICTIDLGK